MTERSASPTPRFPEPFATIGAVDGSYAPLDDVPFADDGNPKTGWIYGTWGKVAPMRYKSDTDRAPTPDERNASWAVSQIKQFSKQSDGQPFFMGIGFIRPHTPLHVPKRYFDMHPLDSLKLPVIKDGDEQDTHYKDVVTQKQKGHRYLRLLSESYPTPGKGIAAFTQAYLACVTAVDDCIGQVVDAIDNSPLKSNTIIIVTSDHGWNMGQKGYLFKELTLGGEHARTPHRACPRRGEAGRSCPAPGLADRPLPNPCRPLFPQGRHPQERQGGKTRRTQHATFPDRPGERPVEGSRWALSMGLHGRGRHGAMSGKDKQNPKDQHWTYRTENWRYIRYGNGMEELYNHRKDPHEWTNLADSPEHATIKAGLSDKLDRMIR